MIALLHSQNAWQTTALVCVALAMIVAGLFLVSVAISYFLRWLEREPEEFRESQITYHAEYRDGRFIKVPDRRPLKFERFRPPGLRTAPVAWCGWMEALPEDEPLELWNLLEDIPGHCRCSTVTRQTLERAGYWVPPAPIPSPKET